MCFSLFNGFKPTQIDINFQVESLMFTQLGFHLMIQSLEGLERIL